MWHLILYYFWSRYDRDRQPTLTTVSELILVSTVDEAMPVSTPTPHSRVVQRSDDAPNRPQLKHKKRKLEDPYNILVSDEREKVKLEVKKFRFEINNLYFHLLFIFKNYYGMHHMHSFVIFSYHCL